MNRRALQALTAALVAGAAGFGFVPLAYGSTDSTISPSVEAWYQANPTCLAPAGCVTAGALPVTPPSASAANPYPKGSLHVAVSAGKETARSYLRFPFEQLTGKAVTTASLEIPLDVNPQDGSAQPQTSKVLVCETTSSKIVASEGTIDTPPPNDCGASVLLKYVASPTPHLQADLGKVGTDLPRITGLALLPDASKTTQGDAWHIVFSAHDRADAAKTGPAKISVTYNDGTTATTNPSTAGITAPPINSPVVAPPGTGIVSDPGTGFAAAPPVQAPATSAVPPTVSAPIQQAPVTTQPRLITIGYAYPAVWLLPLGFLILIPLTVRALTKDLSGYEDR